MNLVTVRPEGAPGEGVNIAPHTDRTSPETKKWRIAISSDKQLIVNECTVRTKQLPLVFHQTGSFQWMAQARPKKSERSR